MIRIFLTLIHIMVKHGSPILITLRSKNKIESTSANNTYTMFIPKPNVQTNKFILKFNGLQMDALSSLTQNARTIDVRINFPSESWDSLTNGPSNSIGYANLINGDATTGNVSLFKTFISFLQIEKVVYVNGGNYTVELRNMSNALITDNATSQLPDHIISLSLIPIYED